jgi:sulfate adenylyltransferase subunit 2
VRFRTLGCYPLTGAIESEADTLPAIIQEMLLTTTSERQGRVIDHDSPAPWKRRSRKGISDGTRSDLIATDIEPT